MDITSYIVKVGISTVIIWVTIHIVDRGNYRNNLKNALLTAIVLNFLGGTPFVFFFSLIIWVFILINYYSVGFFKSFLCVLVYSVIMVIINIVLALALAGGAYTYVKMADTEMYMQKWEEFKEGAYDLARKLPKSLRERLNIMEEPVPEKKDIYQRKMARLFFKNGRVLKVGIIMEGKKWILVDIADGKSEVVIRKDTIDHIEML